MGFLDNNGLKKYTEVFLNYITRNMVHSFNGRSGDVVPYVDDYTPEMVGAVPTSRTINGKALTSDIMLSAEDIGAQPVGEAPEVDLSGYVPISLTINNKPLSSNIALSASDVSALPITGGTLTGNLTIKGSGNYGTKINLGDGDYVHISEPTDDCMEVKASKVNFVLSDTTDEKFTINGSNPFSASDVDLSLYAPKESPVFTGSISLERKNGATVGPNSSAIGHGVEASGIASHAEGTNATASGTSSHAEGHGTVASGSYSHAENYVTKASHTASHAEGSSTEASGSYSHAEGYFTTASALGAHAEGCYTTATNYSSHASGKFNKVMTDGGAPYGLVGDVFVVGNGVGTGESERSNVLRLAYEGTLYLTKAYNSTGADYAEYFEWLDGNPNDEDRVGRFVTLEGTKIKFAQEGDYVLGVISGQPCVIGNADEDWLGRWEHDDFNRFVKEYLVHTETEVFPPSTVVNEEDLMHWVVTNELTERDGHYFKMETEVVDYPTDSWRHKANPSYDPSQPYVERKDRKEWDAVGMVGVLSVVDDGTCVVNGYAKIASNAIATKADTLEFAKSWRVVERVSNNIVKIVFR